MLDRTGSPIEQQFAEALQAVWGERLAWRPERCIREIAKLMDLGKLARDIACMQQVKIGRYRVDFLIAGPSMADESYVTLAIECDGHEFHEKTREQAARDRKRDRFLTMCGYFPVRFTGSEIWHDAVGCAEETANIFEEMQGVTVDAMWARECEKRQLRERVLQALDGGSFAMKAS